MSGCPFCRRIANGEFDTAYFADVVSFEPLNPVTPGHRLFVPCVHVEDAAESPGTTSAVMMAAATAARELGNDCNLIASVGPAATQTVRHLHIHLVPRRPGDGLALPWTGQEEEPPPQE